MKEVQETMQKKILFYCQHVLGMGHLVRSRALVAGLSDYAVTFVNGGELIPGFELPAFVEVVQLPPLKTDATFKVLHTATGQTVADVQRARTQLLLETYERVRPDAVIIELFPFGRKKLAFELEPLLARIRLAGDATKVICSLRDILVERPDQGRYEARACRLANRYFDALLIHADPNFQRLEESFGRVDDLAISVEYTGYVAETEENSEEVAEAVVTLLGDTEAPLILASIGGGRVGMELLTATMEASKLLHATRPHRLLVFGGPYLPIEQLTQLQTQAEGAAHITVRHYTTHFLAFMRRAALSVSMAGYNTCMNIVTTGVPALVLPFIGGDNDEQSTRAHKLAERGIVGVLEPAALQPAVLAARMADALRRPPMQSPFAVNGVANTAQAVARVMAQPPKRATSPFIYRADRLNIQTDASPKNPTDLPMVQIQTAFEQHLAYPVLETELRPVLEQLQARGTTVDLFLRDDDIDEDEETLRHLLDITLTRGVPINVEVIPATLTIGGIGLLNEFIRFHAPLIELDQHGWQHVNHEVEGRKCEFGPSRSFEQQLEDIGQGKALLEATFGEHFFPAFTPPWNRCTEDTFKVVDQLGFKVFSRSRNGQGLSGYGFQEVSVTLDLYRWKEGACMKAPEVIVQELTTQLQATVTEPFPLGLLLHHKVMDAAAFHFFDQLLACLTRYPVVKFKTFGQLVG